MLSAIARAARVCDRDLGSRVQVLELGVKGKPGLD